MLCGTCHIVVAEDWSERIGTAGEDEAAVLEALGQSRGGAAVEPAWHARFRMSEEFDGLTVRVPSYRRVSEAALASVRDGGAPRRRRRSNPEPRSVRLSGFRSGSRAHAAFHCQRDLHI